MGIDAVSPANRIEEILKGERKRRSMNTPQQKLQVPEIPGYYLYWFRGEPERIEQALDAGYEFVDRREVHTYNHDLAGDGSVSGHTDMGSRVSVVDGSGVGGDGQALRLYLMKLREEWHKEDLADAEKYTTKLVHSLKAGTVGIGDKDAGLQAEDKDKFYGGQTNLFQPKHVRRS